MQTEISPTFGCEVQIEAESRQRRMRLIKPYGTTHMRRAMKYRKAFAESISPRYDSCLRRVKTIASSKLRLFARSDFSRGTDEFTEDARWALIWRKTTPRPSLQFVVLAEWGNRLARNISSDSHL